MASAAYAPSIDAPIHSAKPARPGVAAYAGCWGMIGLALIAVPLILAGTGLTVDLASFAEPAAATAMLATVHFVYRHHRPGFRLGDIAGVLAALFASLLLAAIVSHAGLRFRMPLIDDLLAASDRAMGIDTPALVRMAAGHPAAAYWLSIVYNSAIPMMPLTAIGLVLARQEREAWVLCYGFAVSVVLASLISVAIPALGVVAHAHLEGLHGLPPGAGTYYLRAFHAYHDGGIPVLDLNMMSGVVEFPSFHIVMALLVPYALRHHVAAFAGGALWCVLVGISTVPIGGHYVTDLIAGAAMWGCLIALQRRIDGD